VIELPFPPATVCDPNVKRRAFSQAEIGFMQSHYRDWVNAGRLDDLAGLMGRSKSVLSEKARALGVSDALMGRQIAAQATTIKCTGVPKWSEKDHPRGFAGKKHGALAREKSATASNAFWGSLDEAAKQQRVTANLKAAIEKNGRIGPLVPARGGTWKAGWREIGGTRKYYRSRWEANYARYLHWLQNRGDILDWKHEPETFWFETIKRGVRSYLPDFRVWENDGSSKLHEVKGWMDSRSKTTLRRMAKYHPGETIVLVAEKQYREIERRLSSLIEGWE